MSSVPTPTGTPSRPDRGGVPARGCLVALMALIVIALLIAGALMFKNARQNSANASNKNAALQQTTQLANSYEGDLLDEVRSGAPDETRMRALARKHHGTLIRYASSGSSLATVVQFFAAYEDASFFGISDTYAYRCYSFRIEEGADGSTHSAVLPLQECNRI